MQDQVGGSAERRRHMEPYRLPETSKKLTDIPVDIQPRLVTAEAK
jgi:hypothetical protein